MHPSNQPYMKSLAPFRRTFLKSLLCAAAALPLALAAAPAARAQGPGDQDGSFATGPDANGSVRALALQPNGQVLAGGAFTTFRGQARNGVARLNADGSLDTLNPALALSGYNGGGPTVLALALQPNGQVIVGGQFDVLNQIAGVGLARLNADGSLDASFNAGIGVYDNGGSVGQAEALAVLPNGQILVGGAFTNFNGMFSRASRASTPTAPWTRASTRAARASPPTASAATCGPSWCRRTAASSSAGRSLPTTAWPRAASRA